ncbi:major facilitator transporter [Rufibacter radiotolerans]|uniref:Major facilitator transporter n=1 Tax=Rufibacter radiotolerans TaxID=1379910 RepID=A0A0H4VMG5_9BACT|nr:MFS transporter [Rufibacter radiotolerans]AKQ45062.1 major facilitator transporter [Rufibacter radiotolerans]
MDAKLKQRIALGILFFQSGLCFSTWASRIPDIKAAFAFSDSELGTLLLIRPLGAFIGLPFAGWVVDKYGSNYSSVVGILAFSVSLVLLGLSPSVWWLAGAILLFGLSANLTNISINAQALAVQKNYGKTIISSFHGLWSLAGFCGAGLGAVLISLKVVMLYHFLLIMGTVLIFGLLTFKHLSREHQAGSRKFVFKKPEPVLLRLGLIAFCGLLCEGCIYDWAGIYFKQVVQVEAGLVTAGFIAYMGTMALGRMVSDHFTNRFGSTAIIQASGVLIFSGLILAVLFPHLITAILGFVLVGAGTSSVIPLTYAQVGKNPSLSPGISLATVSTIGYFGFLLGPPLIGFIADLLNLRASFALVAVAGLMITVLATLAKRRDSKAATQALTPS